MRERIKKPFLFLLALMMLAGTIPFGALTASAATSAGTETALVKAVNNGADIKLTKDINLSAQLVIPEDTTVSLDLNGKKLSGAPGSGKESGSVILVSKSAVLTVLDSNEYNAGTITGGAAVNGGGICNLGTLTFNGGTVSGNSALDETGGCGGGIYNGPEAVLTLHGGVITENEARNGGGVYNAAGGSVIIESNTIIKKVGIESRERITNITVTGNKAGSLGNGIYNDSLMSLAGAPVINGNSGTDIFNSRGNVIEIAGELTFTGKISISSPGTNAVITQNYSLYNTKKPTAFFTCPDPGTIIRLTAAENGEVMFVNEMKNTVVEVYESRRLIKKEEYENPADAWSKAMGYAKDNTFFWGVSDEKSVVEITLGSDWTSSSCLYTGTKKDIHIDLNGFCLKRDGKKNTDGGIIRIGESSKLTITDSRPESAGYKNHKGGVIADGSGKDCGGGITVEKGGQLYMNAGTLYNCVTDYHGGAVYSAGSHTYIVMKDCTIDSCKTKDSKDDCHGGGIYVSDADNVILSNVTIKNCESEDKGGGLYLRGKPGYVHLSDVKFDGNSANDGGGAIFIDDLNSDKEFEFTAEKCAFTNNRSNDRGGAVYVNDDDESEYRNPTVFTNCVFTGNESSHNGSAIEVNDNGVVLNGGSITGNTTKEKGAVYVEDKYDISVSGKLVIRDNKGKTGNQNLVLEKDDKKAYVYGAGLYKGSEIWVSTSGGGTGFAGVRGISEYQSKYFRPEKGKLNFKKTGTEEAEMVITASLFGDGSKYAVAALAGSGLLIAAAAVIIAKKRKGAVIDDDNDE